jgi:hypothetical protein
MKLSQNLKEKYELKKSDINWSLPIRLLAEELDVSYGSAWKIKNYHDSLPKKPVRQKIETKGDEFEVTHSAIGNRVTSLEDLLRETNTDLDKWFVASHTINTWEQAQAGEEEPEIVTLYQVKARLEKRLIDYLKPANKIEFSLKRGRKNKENHKKVLFIPDTQHGHVWSKDYTKLEPIHDRKGIDAVIKLAREWQPEVVVLLGDMLDLAQWSLKYPRPPEYRQTTGATINELYYDLCRIREACPNSEIVWLEGNHEARIQKALTEILPESVHLAPAGETQPALCIERLLHLEDLGIEYIKPFPADYWLWGCIQITHGEGHGKGVTTKLAKTKSYSMVKGHGHGLELSCSRVETPKGSKNITVMQPGCLCRIDGTVPGVSPRPDWQHGVGFGILDKEGQEHLWAAPIHEGRLYFEGKVYQGEEDRKHLAKTLGIPQLGG